MDLPYSLRIVLENLVRHNASVDQVRAVLERDTTAEIAIHPARVFLHDTNGVPLLTDLAAMRAAMAALGGDPGRVNPVIPSELVVDHSVIADVFGRPDAMARNMELEYTRNAERYQFLKWGQQALRQFAVVPPGTGIMHQVNVEHLARVVVERNGQVFPDLCVGTDSHTTMVNGLGVLGWGIGGIEAEAAMLGESLAMLVPRVVGVRLDGRLPDGATATDLVLTLTEVLRQHGVVGKFVEFHGPGLAAIGVPDRATIANMSPEFGSTCAYFPIDEETVRYLAFTGRSAAKVALVESYAKENELWHDPATVARYDEHVALDLSTVVASVAGPRRPQDRIALPLVRNSFESTPRTGVQDGTVFQDGTVALAAITSCTNTSNPGVMVAAGLLARNAVERGLRSKPWVKTTLSPGSRVVMDYYDKAGLTEPLAALGFNLAGYGCMTCIGASGSLTPELAGSDAVLAAVLSGNRNFDGRINPDVRLNYLASPPLVVAYALTGTVDLDLTTEPLGTDPNGDPVFLRDIWPSSREIDAVIASTVDPSMFVDAYAGVFTGDDRWRSLAVPSGQQFDWAAESTYLRKPPYFDDMPLAPPPVSDILDAQVLALLGDSITTDHISPAGAIPRDSPAGRYLGGRELNTYASRRGNHEVMMRGAFANVRLRNLLVDREGGYTRCGGEVTTIYEAAMAYQAAGVPLVVIAGKDYGTGSSRDWAAKAPALLGVRAVLAESFERIHRANLVGMGILPLQFLDGQNAASLGLTGEEPLSIIGLPDRPTVRCGDTEFGVRVRLDTAREADYYRHGGILPYVLRRLLPTP